MTRNLCVLLRMTWVTAAMGTALCCIGCSDHADKAPCTPILPSREDNALVNGQFDPARIDHITVYTRISWHSYVESLEQCKRIVKIFGEPAISEFVKSLAPEAEQGLEKPAQFPGVNTRGIFEVVLKDGRRLYLGYVVSETAQYIRAPSADFQWEGPGHDRKAWRVWMLRYVYGWATQQRD